MAKMEKALICDFPISTYNLADNYQFIVNGVEQNQGRWVVTLNLEMIYRANVDEEYRNLLHKADLFIADGVPLIWASGFKKDTLKIGGRSNGTDLVEKFLMSDANFRLGIIGGTNPASVVKRYNKNLLTNAYIYDGIVDVEDTYLVDELINGLKKNGVNLLFLGLGVPKQDQLAEIINSKVESITVIGIGGSFDLLSGKKSRAPKWMQENGLEWLYRLLTEPVRLSKRYLVHYPQAVYFLVKDAI